MLRNKTVYRFYYENCLIMKEMSKELGRIGQPLSSVYWYFFYNYIENVSITIGIVIVVFSNPIKWSMENSKYIMIFVTCVNIFFQVL